MAEADPNYDAVEENNILLLQFEDLFTQVTRARDQVNSYARTKVSLFKDKHDLVRHVRRDVPGLLASVHRNNSFIADPKARLDLSKKVASLDEVIESITVKYYEAVDFNRAAPVTPAPAAAAVHAGVRLPHITVPVFSNDVKEFPRFFKLFEAVYDKNPGLAAADKFYYLQSLLSGEALALVDHYPLTDAGYGLAVTALKERFDCQRTLASTYLNELLNYVPAKRASCESLKKFLEVHNDNVKALKSMSGVADLGDFILLNLALRNLDPYSRRLFEQECDANVIPHFQDVVLFVSKSQHAMSLIEAEKVTPAPAPPQPKSAAAKPLLLAANSNKPAASPANKSAPAIVCTYCNATNHKITRCSTFLAKPTLDRTNWVKSANRCLACLSNAHVLTGCKSARQCIYCQGKNHNSLLCPNRGQQSASPPAAAATAGPSAPALCSAVPAPSQQNPAATPAATPSGGTPAASTMTCTSAVASPAPASKFTTMLGTIVCHVVDNAGFIHEVNAVLDTGSQKDLISLSTANRLGLNVSNACTSEISGIADTKLCTLGDVTVVLQSRTVANYRYTVSASILTKIANDLAPTAVHPDFVTKLSHLNLADPRPFASKEVHMLLSAASTLDILRLHTNTPPEIPNFPEQWPKPMFTQFGYVIMGHVPTASNPPPSVSFLAINPPTPLPIQIQNLFERECVSEPNESSLPDPEHIKIENHFLSSHSRDADGRFVVSLPFVEDPPPIGCNKSRAIASFRSLESRLLKSPEAYPIYQASLQDYFDKGQIVPSAVPVDFLFNSHVVFKRSTGKPKLVFDPTLKAPGCSATFNDLLMCGPPLQRPINYILLSSRWHRYCFTADIETFYRSIKVSDADAEKMHMLARIDSSGRVCPNGSVSEVKITHLCYGLKCSPFVALRCLQQLAYENAENLPLASQALSRNTYIDDVWAGAASLPECTLLRLQLTELLAKGCFKLGQFAASHPEIIHPQVNPDHAPQVIEFVDATIPVLGLNWKPATDIFCFKIEPFTGPVTRRTCTSYLAKTYDSLGLLHPPIFWMKKFVQSLWCVEPLWDTVLSAPLCLKWVNFVSDLPSLSAIEIPRFIAEPEGENWYAVFSDASESGIACCAYLVSRSTTGTYSSNLLIAKSKLAPQRVKRTIPQLELAAIELASNLIAWLHAGNLPYCIKGTCLFSDSTIALAYLKIPVHKLKVYTANRVSNIMEKTKNLNVSFMHCRSHDNAADSASRGMNPAELIADSTMWFHGPEFLRHEFPPESPDSTVATPELPDLKPKVLLTNIATPAPDDSNVIVSLINKCSDFRKLRRIVAYVLRFTKRTKVTGPLSVDELNAATLTVVKQQQQCSFNMKNIPANKELLTLTPFVDQHGLLRVGGRLQSAPIADSARHPLILPKSCNLSVILCRYFHHLAGHGGSSLSLSLSRQSFWIIAGRSLMRSVIHKCVLCAKLHPRKPAPQQANLPSFRTEMCFPFRDVVGVDAFGPYSVKLSARRNSASQKIWALLFVCENTRAVHIEPISSLSAKDYLAALDRFVSRRGLPKVIRSDNAGNFTAGAKHLSECARFLEQEKDSILSATAQRGIKFSHIPVYAPWFGSWEPQIKQVKRFLKPLLTNHMYFEEYCTIFSRVEALMNSRPYLPPSADVTDPLEILCPGSFLVGGPLLLPPEAPADDNNHQPQSIHNRWDRLRAIVQLFWKRWSREVLHSLQQKLKWPRCGQSVALGDLVWIPDANTVPGTWPLGIISKIYPDRSGDHVRIVDVKTAGGTLCNRAVRNLILVPTRDA